MARVRHVPERRCVACNEKVPKRQLFRIVRSPEGTVSAIPQARHRDAAPTFAVPQVAGRRVYAREPWSAVSR